MRIARKHIVTKDGGFFHVLNRLCGFPGYYPLQDPLVQDHFISRLRYVLACYCIHCAGFTLMGNHFHLVLFNEKFRRLSRRKLQRLARARWGQRWKLKTASWSDQRWHQFNLDVFDLSSFMRDLQGPFSCWFNQSFDRIGHLWRDRFKSLSMQHDLDAVQETLMYVELNPVRAGLETLPELWKAGSAYLRSIGQDDFLIPLEDLFPELQRTRVQPFYRALVLYRALHPSRIHQAAIPQVLVDRELERGFSPGAYLKRHRFLSDGLMLGRRDTIHEKLLELSMAGLYRRRRHPIPQLHGLFFSLREQRSHCRS